MTVEQEVELTSTSLARVERHWSNRVVQPEIYTDEAIHQAERDRIFAHMWQFLAHESEIPDVGDFVVRYILDDAIIVTRGTDGAVHALLNTCSHRGMPVCRAELGSTSRFTCPYHGWQFDIDGHLAAVPMERPYFSPDGLDREQYSLSPIARCETWEGFIFGSLADTGPSFADYVGDFAWYLNIHTARDPGGLEVIGEPQRWRMRANWKTGAENFAGDSYHAQYTHRSVFTIGLHPNKPRDFQVSGTRNGVHIDAGPGTMALARQSALDRGYPPAMVEGFRENYPSDLDTALFEGETPLWPTRTHLFPNMSFLNAGSYLSDTLLVPFLTCRVWRPLGPQETEVWSWILVEQGASEEFKRHTRRAFTLTFGTTGTEEQDDVEAFHTLSRALTGATTSTMHQELVLGDGLDPADTELDWIGPGNAVATTLTDAGNRRFLELWGAAMW